jgi:hypothetical protein
MYDMTKNNAFDLHMLPDNLLVDGATNDLGPEYADRLVSMRQYLRNHHPLVRRLATIADIPGKAVDLNPYLRMEASTLRSGTMELAFVNSGVSGPEDRPNKVLYFDIRRHEQGLPPMYVSRHNALYELLMFPLLYETGTGGFFKAKDSKVESTTGTALSLQAYARAMLFQNERLHYLGRLGQEYALVQHSRNVEDTLAFQRNSGLQGVLKRRRDVNPRPGAARLVRTRQYMAK